jgi:hypothetical protein
LEDEYGIDIFESGQVESVKDILEKINIKRWIIQFLKLLNLI